MAPTQVATLSKAEFTARIVYLTRGRSSQNVFHTNPACFRLQRGQPWPVKLGYALAGHATHCQACQHGANKPC